MHLESAFAAARPAAAHSLTIILLMLLLATLFVLPACTIAHSFATSISTASPQLRVSGSEAEILAQKAVTLHEHWPTGAPQTDPNLHEVLTSSSSPNRDGSWTVTVHEAIMKKDTGSTNYLPHSKRTVVINKSGKVKSYTPGEDYQ